MLWKHVDGCLLKPVQNLMVERDRNCLNSVWSHEWPALSSVAETHMMEDFYVTDHDLDRK